MSLALRVAARSDVGLMRDGNEDSGYAGPSLLAVADGMGGHAAGEVASSLAVATLARLEDDVAGGDLLDNLARAVAEANSAISNMVTVDPKLDGMGTTLTAMLWAGRRLGLVHVGDSRAYLLRDGELEQITHDHTFVQTLVDENRITPEEADHHPQRSLLLRALDGRGDPDPDLSVREVRLGDRYLLCSDGLSGVVPFETIAKTLGGGDPDAAADRLVELALQAGGPDNITCIVAEVVETDEPPPGHPMLVGAAAEKRNRSGSGHATAEFAVGDTGDAARGSGGFGWFSRGFVLLLALVLVAGAGWAAYAWSQRQYYVGADAQQVAIFRGLPQEIAGRSLSELYERQDVLLYDLSAETQASVRDTIFAGDIGEARKIVDRLREQAAECRQARARTQSPTPAPQPAPQLAPRPAQPTAAATRPPARPPATPATPVRTAAAAPAPAPTPTPVPTPAAAAQPADDCGEPGA